MHQKLFSPTLFIWFFSCIFISYWRIFHIPFCSGSYPTNYYQTHLFLSKNVSSSQICPKPKLTGYRPPLEHDQLTIQKWIFLPQLILVVSVLKIRLHVQLTIHTGIWSGLVCIRFVRVFTPLWELICELSCCYQKTLSPYNHLLSLALTFFLTFFFTEIPNLERNGVWYRDFTEGWTFLIL